MLALNGSLRASALIKTPFGGLLLETDGECLSAIAPQSTAEGWFVPATPLLREASRQFQAYFDDPAWTFALPLRTMGTPYQQSVWHALRTIPPGSTKTYAGIAAELRSGSRAVAGACRANPFPLIIPCHRVVASHGLGGYCGAGAGAGAFLEIKRWLLRHEGYEFT